MPEDRKLTVAEFVAWLGKFDQAAEIRFQTIKMGNYGEEGSSLTSLGSVHEIAERTLSGTMAVIVRLL